MKKRALKVTIYIVSAIIAIIFVAMAIVINFVLTPERMTPLVREMAKEYVVSDATIGRVDVSYFSSFPNLAITIDSLRIRQIDHSIDDLIAARRCVVAINPLALLRHEIAIDEITIKRGDINLYVDSLTRPTQLFRLPNDTTTVERKNSAGYNLLLNRLRIDSSTIVIDDKEKDFYSKMGGFSVDMGLRLASDMSALDAEVELGEFSVRLKEHTFASSVSMGLRSHIKHYRDSSLFTIDDTQLRVNNIEMNVDGTLRGNKAERSLMVDLKSTMSTPSITEFLDLVPAYLFDQKESVSASGAVDMQFDINGIYSADHYPEIRAKLLIEEGKANYESRKLEIERIDCDADMLIDLNTPQNSYATINKLFVNTSDVLNLAVKGRVNNIINSPEFDIDVDSDIDFDRLNEIFPLREGVTLKGRNTSDLHTKFMLSDIEHSNYGNLYIDGTSHFLDVAVDINGALFTKDSTATSYLKLDIRDGELLFGDKVRENNSRTLLATINVNGVGFKDRFGQYASIKNLKLTSGANFDSKTKKVNGIGIRAEGQNTIFGIDGEVEMNMASTDATFTISPKNEERDTKIYALINSQSIEAQESLYNSTMSLSNVDMTLNLLRTGEKMWDTDGDVGFQHLKMHSDLFPLQMAIPRSRVSVLNNRITLDNARLKLGESTIVATGYITNLIRVFFFDSDRKMEGELNIKSPLLNVNELMRATTQSVLMSEEKQDVIAQDSTSMATLPPPPIEADSTGMMPLIPKNVNFLFDLNIDSVKVNKTYVESVAGLATIKEGVLTLDELTLDAIGAKAWSTLRYENLSDTSSKILFDMKLKGVQVGRIGELLPDVAAMMPMINSVNGGVDFDLKSSMSIDQDLNIDMEHLRAASSLSGENLILKEGEDFEELAKAMMFKNKEQSLIENLQVYMTVDKSNMRVLPFEIAIDRYKAIIGGEQRIDMEEVSVDYDYHISVIKSPLPFKAGVDISGVNEDFDFKITKAKLKKSNFDALRKEYLLFRESIE